MNASNDGTAANNTATQGTPQQFFRWKSSVRRVSLPVKPKYDIDEKHLAYSMIR